MEPRAYLSGASGTPPPYPINPMTGYPRTATTTLPATVPGPWWFYMISEELRHFLVQTDQSPNPYDNSQIYKGLVHMINNIA